MVALRRERGSAGEFLKLLPMLFFLLPRLRQKKNRTPPSRHFVAQAKYCSSLCRTPSQGHEVTGKNFPFATNSKKVKRRVRPPSNSSAAAPEDVCALLPKFGADVSGLSWVVNDEGEHFIQSTTPFPEATHLKPKFDTLFSNFLKKGRKIGVFLQRRISGDPGCQKSKLLATSSLSG